MILTEFMNAFFFYSNIWNLGVEGFFFRKIYANFEDLDST